MIDEADIRMAERMISYEPGSRMNPVYRCDIIWKGLSISPGSIIQGTPVCNASGEPIKRIYNRKTKNYELRCKNDH